MVAAESLIEYANTNRSNGVRVVTIHTDINGVTTVTESRPQSQTEAEASKAVPCKFVGEELTGAERESKGLDHARKWLLCLHPARPLGEVVCQCKGCGPGCPGYATEPQS